MNEQTWVNPVCDRSQWGPGEWDGEPDKVQWTDEATGLVCLARRNERHGNWCGYVGVPPSHPWHGKGYSDLPDYGPDVHGGLTYAGDCDGDPIQGICQIPEAGQPDHLYWFGFDCHHAWDLAPGMVAILKSINASMPSDRDDVYRPLSYVKVECAQLAKQLAAVSEEASP